jgi:hypothetical protein
MQNMITVPFLITIIIGTAIGTFPLVGPLFSGLSAGIIIGRRDTAMVIAFLGTILGGVFCRIFLLYPENIWHFHLLYLLGNNIGDYLELIIRGNIFFSALYFGILGILGGLMGVNIISKIRGYKNHRGK